MERSLVPAPNPADFLNASVETFLAGRAPNTRRAYRTRLNQFSAWLAEQPPAPFVAQLRQYIAYLQDKGLSERSVQAHVNTIKGVIKLAAALDTTGKLAAALPTLELAKPPSIRGEVQGERLSAAQRQQLIYAPGTGTLRGKRDTAILALLSVCGLRRSEVSALSWEHVGEIDGYKVVKNLTGKHGRTRTVKLPKGLYELLEAYAGGGELDTSPETPVFVAIGKGERIQHGQRLTASAVAWLVKEYARRIGLHDISPHDLRRTAASLARKGGASIEQVQIMLGHASPQTTSQYIGEGLDLDDHAVDYSDVEFG
jgi:integrase